MLLADCKLYAVGKAVYTGHTEEELASWMRDPQPASEPAAEQFWATRQHENHTLYEYHNKTTFRVRSHARKIHLPLPFQVGRYSSPKGLQ